MWTAENKERDGVNIDAYLERIGYAGPIRPDYSVLCELQRSHLMTVPFENLDIHYHIPIDLTQSYDKIVTKHRGGFCYELNGLFFELLTAAGFSANRISARVFGGSAGPGPEFDHLAILVVLEGEMFLVDVGFGDFTIGPLRINDTGEQQDPAGVFRIEQYDEMYRVVKKKDPAGEFQPEYIFTGQERKLSDFFEMCRYHQTSESSHFTQKRLCSLPVAGGRITLTGNILKSTIHGIVTEKELKTEEEVRTVLAELFRISLPAG